MPLYVNSAGDERFVEPKVQPILLQVQDGELRPALTFNCEGHTLMLLMNEVEGLISTLIQAKQIAERDMGVHLQKEQN